MFWWNGKKHRRPPILKVDNYNKYSHRREVDNYKFESLKMAKAYVDLKIRAMNDEIEQLQIHPIFSITFLNCHVCDVILSFKFYDNILSKYRYISAESFEGDLSKIKLNKLERKLVEVTHGINIECL